MSKKEIPEPVKEDEGQTNPKLALSLLLVLVCAFIILGLKAFGII